MSLNYNQAAIATVHALKERNAGPAKKPKVSSGKYNPSRVYVAGEAPPAILSRQLSKQLDCGDFVIVDADGSHVSTVRQNSSTAPVEVELI